MSHRFMIASCIFVAALTANAVWAQAPKPKDGPLGMKFVPLPKATFYMGGGGGKAGRKTEIKEDFEIAIHTVTQGQWQEVMGNNPSYFSRNGGGKNKVKDIKDEDLKQFPVDTVAWSDAQEFIKKLNEKEKGKDYQYRLPIEVEWEFACRGGATSEEECSYHFYFAKPTNDLSSKEANFSESFLGGRTTKVGSYAPNKVGLYDMHGNVCQWCEDLYNPKGSDRVYRGGSWTNSGILCQAGRRFAFAPTNRDYNFLGFRLARVPVLDQPAKPAPKDGPLGMKFVPLPKATFYMGGGGGKAGKKTEIRADFEIAIHTVTQGQWQTLMGNNPSRHSRAGDAKGMVKHIKDEDLKHFPVETVSWNDAQEFIKKLNEQEKKTGWLYRLPSDAEWEYACRGGATSEEECSYHFYFAKPTNDISTKEANYDGRDVQGGKVEPSLHRTTKVGSYAPNKLGLYDMHGNVYQWCEDLDKKGAPFRAAPGGSYCDTAGFCRAADRRRQVWSQYRNHDLGFRLARVPVR